MVRDRPEGRNVCCLGERATRCGLGKSHAKFCALRETFVHESGHARATSQKCSQAADYRQLSGRLEVWANVHPIDAPSKYQRLRLTAFGGNGRSSAVL